MADDKSKKNILAEMLDLAAAEAKAAAATGVRIAAGQKTGSYTIGVDMTAAEQNPTPGRRNFRDPEDILLQLRTGEGSTDSVSVGGQKVDFTLPPEVEATMASLLSQAQQGDNVARSELGAMVKTIAQDALQANEKNQSR